MCGGERKLVEGVLVKLPVGEDGVFWWPLDIDSMAVHRFSIYGCPKNRPPLYIHYINQFIKLDQQ